MVLTVKIMAICRNRRMYKRKIITLTENADLIAPTSLK